jgi:hypothetical protein
MQTTIQHTANKQSLGGLAYWSVCGSMFDSINRTEPSARVQEDRVA